MLYSESKNKLNYMIKNLIILDRMVEAKLFLWEISDVSIETAERFTDENKSINDMQIDQLIRKYFAYIKAKAKKYTNKDSCFNGFAKSSHIKSLNVNQLIQETNCVQELIGIINDVQVIARSTARVSAATCSSNLTNTSSCCS